MKTLRLILLVLSLLSIVISAQARQRQVQRDPKDVLSALQKITLPSSKKDSVNIAEVIGSNPLTLIVMYRGVW